MASSRREGSYSPGGESIPLDCLLFEIPYACLAPCQEGSHNKGIREPMSPWRAPWEYAAPTGGDPSPLRSSLRHPNLGCKHQAGSDRKIRKVLHMRSVFCQLCTLAFLACWR